LPQVRARRTRLGDAELLPDVTLDQRLRDRPARGRIPSIQVLSKTAFRSAELLRGLPDSKPVSRLAF